MSNFKKIIAKNFVLCLSLLICVIVIFFLFTGMDEIWDGCSLCLLGVGMLGIFGCVGLMGIIISLIPNKLPPKILFYSLFFFFVIVIVSSFKDTFLLRGHDCYDLQQESLNSRDVETNNEEETKITWKKYTNPLYGFSFEYPDYLKITEDKENDNPFTPKGYWRIKMESADYEEQAVVEEEPATGTDVISGFGLGVYADITAAITFEELKEMKQLGHGGFPIIKQETKESNSREFFVQTTQETFNDLDWSVSTLYKPNLSIGMGIGGTKENKEEMEMILNHFMETLE